jgi:hypothetical protein
MDLTEILFPNAASLILLFPTECSIALVHRTCSFYAFAVGPYYVSYDVMSLSPLTSSPRSIFSWLYMYSGPPQPIIPLPQPPKFVILEDTGDLTLGNLVALRFVSLADRTCISCQPIVFFIRACYSLADLIRDRLDNPRMQDPCRLTAFQLC